MTCLKQHRDLQLSLPRRILIFILGFLDNALFGGAIFGWPQLVYVLKVEGVFGDLCDVNNLGIGGSQASNFTDINSDRKNLDSFFENVSSCDPNFDSEGFSNGTVLSNFRNEEVIPDLCPAQDERFALIYTIAVVCYGVPGVVVGFLLHYAGLMITRMLGGFLVATSFIFLALTTSESPSWLFPAMILLSVGGNQIRMSGMQFGDLFPRNRSTTITVLSGVYAASASLFILFPIAGSYGISRASVCYFLGVFSFVSALLSTVMPMHHIPYSEEISLEMREKKLEQSTAPLRHSLLSLSSHLHNFWFVVTLFCMNLYQQFYNVWVTASTCTQAEAGLYSSLFSYSNLICVFCAPIGGMFTDYLIRKAKKDQTDRIKFMTKEIQANFLPLFLTTFFAMAMQCCLFFFSPVAIIISLVCMTIVRPCVVAISTAYLRIRFPGDHFNRLLGIYCTIASAMMFFQYPVFQMAQVFYYEAMSMVAIFVLLTFSNPLHILFTNQVRKWVESREKPSTSDSSQPLRQNT